MTTQIKRTPPIVVDTDVERLMTGDMLKIRDIALEGAFKVSESMGVPIEEVLIDTWESPEEDWEFVDFNIYVLADEETVSSFWKRVADEVAKSKPGMSEDMLTMFTYQVGIAVEQYPPFMLRRERGNHASQDTADAANRGRRELGRAAASPRNGKDAMKKALLSVYDKTGVEEIAGALAAAGFELVSTGGTARAVADAGLAVTEVAELAGSPEILDGRVKTLHPAVHGGILARRELEAHRAELDAHGIAPIDAVVCNLYPFARAATAAGASLEVALENIDIGGVALIRSAAKNFPNVVVLTSPSDYGWAAERLADGGGGGFTMDERRELARKAFQHTALYDTAVARYLAGESGGASREALTFGFERKADLRYGENPHQQAALYSAALAAGGVADAELLHGIPMSYTNYLDADAAWRAVSDFSEPAATVVKHANACGLAVHEDQPTAYRRAFEGDSVSAYGGVVGFNRAVSAATAAAMRGVLYDIIIAPDYDEDALEILRRRRRTRVLRARAESGAGADLDLRLVSGGALVQTPDSPDEDPSQWRVATERAPSAEQTRDLAFAWKAAKHIKSNAITLAKDGAMVGMGAGQPNRVVSVRLALRVAGEKARGAALASDAFFPFADSVETAAAAGVASIVQPGGSMRDDESIAAANWLGVAMLFTGTRHFRH